MHWQSKRRFELAALTYWRVWTRTSTSICKYESVNAGDADQQPEYYSFLSASFSEKKNYLDSWGMVQNEHSSSSRESDVLTRLSGPVHPKAPPISHHELKREFAVIRVRTRLCIMQQGWKWQRWYKQSCLTLQVCDRLQISDVASGSSTNSQLSLLFASWYTWDLKRGMWIE